MELEVFMSSYKKYFPSLELISKYNRKYDDTADVIVVSSTELTFL